MKRLITLLLLTLPVLANAQHLHDMIVPDTTNYSVEVKIIDSTDGTPETGVVWNTSGIDLWYRRQGAVVTSITEATLAALTTAHADGGFLHQSDGVYRLDLPDAAAATGVNYFSFGGTVTGMIVIGGRVNITIEDTTAQAAAIAAFTLSGETTAGSWSKAIQDIEVDTGTTLQADLDLLTDATILASSTCDSGTTTTCVDATLTEANDYWKGAAIVFTSTTLAGQSSCVYDFVAASDTLTFRAVTTAVVAHTYLLVENAVCEGVVSP